jgi:ATP-dependent RNA helicase SUPV3L1/SUV3
MNRLASKGAKPNHLAMPTARLRVGSERHLGLEKRAAGIHTPRAASIGGHQQMFAPRVRAVLGPTNTGKTHLAMTRLLGHASGIIGFPLRLLARENYDRIVSLKGARHVALITGEEKIVPPEARWFCCTVEAMPLDRHCEFLAVDEIQLCADADRGHVFTDRLLHARGMVETMFLGAETIRPLLSRLVPEAEIETRPRLSRLEFAGSVKLTRLPQRSAIVAFSAAEVYAIAEMIRRRRGGCAVVMGRLSPRTRNAQVALYQDGEVDFLVATDAIGMGLNMDVNHVAFAGLQKFDGHRPRRLTAAEVAQIAGRAGRGMRDGTFGTTGTCPDLPAELVEAVQAHSFDPLEALSWRNSELDFNGIDALLDSLMAPPPGPGLVRGNDASDVETLAALARDPDVRALAHGRRRVRLLWEACQVPDFRKITDDSHARLCARIFSHSARGETLPEDWLETQFAALGRAEGDIDTLMARLAGVRVWSFIAARGDWVRDAAHWQGRAREAEDRLSDALHERLTARFVDRRAAHLMRRLEAVEGGAELLSAVTARGEVVVEGHVVGHAAGFAFHADPMTEGAEKRLVQRAARRALHDEMRQRVATLEAAADTAFTLQPDQTLAWEGVSVARLRPGAMLTRPLVEVLDSEFLDGRQRERVRQRLVAFLEGILARDLAPLHRAISGAKGEPTLRGTVHLLLEAGGVVPGATEEGVPPAQRARLKALGVRAGRFALFMPDLLKPRSAALRALLWAVHHRVPTPALPAPGLVSLPGAGGAPDGFLAAMGWVQAGPVMLRLDMAERVAAELAWATRNRPAALPAGLAFSLGVKAEAVPPVLRALGLRLIPAPALAAGQFGPPSPPLIGSPRKRVVESKVAEVARPGGPFAALAALRKEGRLF